MRISAAVAALAASTAADAVWLGADGTGQALIYPYYTARPHDGGQFNTYISVVNQTSRAKALRVNVREARMAKAVASFNLFLSPNDVWTGAIVPAGDGARIISNDTSCTDPPVTSFDLHGGNFTGANDDGAGSGLARTREGYIEVLEMATLSGRAATAVTHMASATPANCAVIQEPGFGPLEAPGGGLSGTLTVIDITQGRDFTVNAEALDGLARQPYYRVATDPSADFTAPEIEPVSTVIHQGRLYRSVWTRPENAVSATLMREAFAEYTLDTATRSRTDLVMAFPTRRLHVTPALATPPFSRPAIWEDGCGASGARGEQLAVVVFNREERGLVPSGSDFPSPTPGNRWPVACAAVAAAGVNNGQEHAHFGGNATGVLGYASLGFRMGPSPSPYIPIPSQFQAGWIRVAGHSQNPVLVSQPSSSRIDLATGGELLGPHSFAGLPIVGFSARTFANGRLDCDGAACQGNFGGAFPFRYGRSITP